MCRVLAYIGPELPLENLLLKPENSLINQALDPELHPLFQLAGWGFGAWSDHLLKPDEPLLYRRPMAAFYDDNAIGVIPSLQASTVLSHVRAAAYNSKTVLADENCHPFSFKGTPWIMAHNGNLSNLKLLQRELLSHCSDEYLKQMRGTTDTEFIYVLLLSLLKSDSDEDVKLGFEKMLNLIVRAMKKLGLPALNKLKIALVSPNRIIGINYGTGHKGEMDVTGDWKELRKSGPGTKDHKLSMVLEPMYVLTGRNFQHYEHSYDIDVCENEEATSAIFASEPLTENADHWLNINFGEIITLQNKDGNVAKRVSQLNL